jgi:ADP-ribose pyrophosphatase YjhB (NUDIX family)
MKENSKNSMKIKFYLCEKDTRRDYQYTTRALIELLAPYTHTDIMELDVKLINDMIEEHRLKCLYIKEFILVCSENSRDELRKYIEDLEYLVVFFQEDIERYQQKIEKLMKQIQPPLTLEETDRRLRKMIDETDKELFSKLLPFFLRRAEELRKTVSCHDCSSLILLQNICSILELDDHEAISRIKNYFEDKPREQILSDDGLAIILAISNISGYSGEYERSMKGNYTDDKSMFDELFVEDPNFGLVSFPSLVYRAFEHPFIQSALPIENESTRETLETSLRCMNNFSRRLNDINNEVLLTMDRSLASSDERRILFADRYFLWVPDIWNVLPTLSEKNLLSESGI